MLRILVSIILHPRGFSSDWSKKKVRVVPEQLFPSARINLEQEIAILKIKLALAYCCGLSRIKTEAQNTSHLIFSSDDHSSLFLFFCIQTTKN